MRTAGHVPLKHPGAGVKCEVIISSGDHHFDFIDEANWLHHFDSS
jgi:hypothetical protein